MILTDAGTSAVANAYAELRLILSKLEDGIILEEMVDVDDIAAAIDKLEEAFPELILLEEPDPGEMDGDAASALASAGFGTDEDYGGGEDNERL
jgi:hypothetical protein